MILSFESWCHAASDSTDAWFRAHSYSTSLMSLVVMVLFPIAVMVGLQINDWRERRRDNYYGKVQKGPIQ